MKTIKIAGIFILVIALFAGIIKLFSFINHGGSFTIGKADEAKWEKDIEDSWMRVEWDTNTFNDNMAMLGTIRNNKYLVEMNYAYALDNLWNAMTSEYHRSNCSTIKIETYHKTGVLFLKRRAPSLSKEEKFIKMESLYELYSDMDQFFSNGFLKTPKKFNPIESGYWEPQYKKYRSTQEKRAAHFKQDTSLYNHLKNITRFNDGYRSLSINLDTAELRYMEAIYKQVNNNKKNINCDSLNCIYNRFKEDFKSIINRDRTALNKANKIGNLRCN